MIGLLESLLTAQILDDIADTRSDKDRESRGQGLANVATGFLGGMAALVAVMIVVAVATFDWTSLPWSTSSRPGASRWSSSGSTTTAMRSTTASPDGSPGATDPDRQLGTTSTSDPEPYPHVKVW